MRDDDQTHFTLEKHSISVSAKVLALVAVTLLTIIGLQTWLNIGGAEQQNSAAEQERLTHLYNSYRPAWPIEQMLKRCLGPAIVKAWCSC